MGEILNGAKYWGPRKAAKTFSVVNRQHHVGEKPICSLARRF